MSRCSPWIQINPHFLDLFKKNNLHDYLTLLHYQKGVRVTASGTTQTLKIRCEDQEFYLKTYRYPRFIFKYSLFPSRVFYEWRSLHLLHQWGLKVPEPVLYGEERSWFLRLKSALILTQSIPHSQNLDEFFPQFFQREHNSLWQEEKKNILKELAREVARIHEQKFIMHDLFWRNILIQEKPEPCFYFIDTPKGEPISPYWGPLRQWRREWGIIKDLASLDKTASDYFSPKDRIRFLKYYLKESSLFFKKPWRILAQKVLKAGDKMRHRSSLKIQERQHLDRTLEFASSEVKTLFTQEGLASYNALFTVDGTPVSSHGTRKVLRKTFSEGSVAFIKISRRPHLKNVIPLALRGCSSVSRFEKQNLEHLRKKGFLVPEVWVLGERLKWGLEYSSFLVLPAFPQVESLEDRLFSFSASAILQEIPIIALLLRRLHEQGIYHRDLYTKHLLGTSTGAYALIDLQRCLFRSPWHFKLSLQDLSALVLTTPQKKLNSRMILLFLRYYLTGSNQHLTTDEKKRVRPLIQGIRLRVQHSRFRKKFKKFFEGV